jgi:hypothetical protein
MVTLAHGFTFPLLTSLREKTTPCNTSSILIEADGDTVDTIEHGTDDATASLTAYVASTGFSLVQTYWHGSTLTAIVTM